MQALENPPNSPKPHFLMGYERGTLMIQASVLTKNLESWLKKKLFWIKEIRNFNLRPLHKLRRPLVNIK